MNFIKNILVMSLLLFFIGCTAWPALVPVPPGKKKTSIYPVPLPDTKTSSIPDIRIGQIINGSPTAVGDTYLAYTNSIQLIVIDKEGKQIATGTTWASGTPTVATVDSSTGLVIANSTSTDGNTEITATNATISATPGSLKIFVNATGKNPNAPATSVLAFDGKNFLIIKQTESNEEK